MVVDLASIERAGRAIGHLVRRTPIISSHQLDGITDARIFCKCENFQRTGSFKFRGALNAVLALDASRAGNGVATHSSGNHGAALARAASMHGIAAQIIVPRSAPPIKLAAIRSYGGELHICENGLPNREAALAQVIAQSGATFIPPYDDARIIEGQGTIGLELLEQISQIDIVVTPVGGGGMLAGVATAIKELIPGVRVVGAEPAGADDAKRSLQSGVRITSHHPDTIADGLHTTLGELNFEIIKRKVDAILTVDDASIVNAMRLVWTRLKIVIEPSAAVTLAAVLSHPEQFRGKRVVLVFSGGNLDPDALPW